MLAAPLARALALAAAGTALIVLVGWPASPVGAVALAASAWTALRGVWRWERTRLIVSADRLMVVRGTVRRRTAAAPLAASVEVEQTLLGRLLGYGTVLAGELEVAYAPREIVRRLA